jgi:formylglycine-generating enzyme required for sulfatase activity
LRNSAAVERALTCSGLAVRSTDCFTSVALPPILSAKIWALRMHIVFISYASEDKAVADAICTALEQAGVRCWIAPRDINAGANWAKSILDAIVTTKLMVLIYSKHTARSPHVRREIERAVHRDILLAPLRTENIMPEGELEYFLSSSHWSDLFPGPIEPHVAQVPAKICALLGIKPKQTKGVSQKQAGSNISQSAPEVESLVARTAPVDRRKRVSTLAILIAAIAFCCVVAIAYAVISRRHSPETPEVSQSTHVAQSESTTQHPDTPVQATVGQMAMKRQSEQVDLIRNLMKTAKSADTIDKAKLAIPEMERVLRLDAANEEAKSELQRLHALSDEKTLFQSLGVEWVHIIPKDFLMGSPIDEKGREPIETQHSVHLTRSYYLAKTEITQGQWHKVMDETFADHCARVGATAVFGEGDNVPMYFVSWTEASDFCRKLSQMSGQRVRLPTEAEWEYAARAGSTQAYCFGADVSQLADYGWFADNSGMSRFDSQQIYQTDKAALKTQLNSSNCGTHAVATRKPNAWGLFDMQGNVWEWCSDVFAPYSMETATDPQGASATGANVQRIARGGSWANTPSFCRAASRFAFKPEFRGNGVGFRITVEDN